MISGERLAKVKKLDAILHKISGSSSAHNSLDATVASDVADMEMLIQPENIKVELRDDEAENLSYKTPTRRILRTGLEQDVAFPTMNYNEENEVVVLNSVPSYIEEWNRCQMNTDVFDNRCFHSNDMIENSFERLQNLDLIKETNPKSLDLESQDTVQARRTILDAYLYNEANAPEHEPSFLFDYGVSSKESFVVVHPVEATGYHCEICKRQFRTKKTLKRHLKNIHRRTPTAFQIDSEKNIAHPSIISESGMPKNSPTPKSSNNDVNKSMKNQIIKKESKKNKDTDKKTNNKITINKKDKLKAKVVIRNQTLSKAKMNINRSKVRKELELSSSNKNMKTVNKKISHSQEKSSNVKNVNLGKQLKVKLDKFLSTEKSVLLNSKAKGNKDSRLVNRKEKGEKIMKYKKKLSTDVAAELKKAEIKNHTNSRKSAPMLSKLESSTEEKVSKPMPFTCQFCNMGFRNASDLNRHTPFHSMTKYHCYRCDEIFLNMRSLTKHLLVHKDDPPMAGMQFRCKVCSQSFEDQSSLNKHVTKHVTKNNEDRENHKKATKVVKSKTENVPGTEVGNQEVITCKSCKLVFDDHPTFEDHVKKKHIQLGDTSLQCDRCEGIFVDGNSVVSHLITQHELSSREARGIMRKKEADAVFLGINASIEEKQDAIENKTVVKPCLSEGEKKIFRSKSDNCLDTENVLQLGKDASDVDAQMRHQNVFELNAENPPEPQIMEDCFLEEQESKNILQALFIEVDDEELDADPEPIKLKEETASSSPKTRPLPFIKPNANTSPIKMNCSQGEIREFTRLKEKTSIDNADQDMPVFKLENLQPDDRSLNNTMYNYELPNLKPVLISTNDSTQNEHFERDDISSFTKNPSLCAQGCEEVNPNASCYQIGEGIADFADSNKQKDNGKRSARPTENVEASMLGQNIGQPFASREASKGEKNMYKDQSFMKINNNHCISENIDCFSPSVKSSSTSSSFRDGQSQKRLLKGQHRPKKTGRQKGIASFNAASYRRKRKRNSANWVQIDCPVKKEKKLMVVQHYNSNLLQENHDTSTAVSGVNSAAVGQESKALSNGVTTANSSRGNDDRLLQDKSANDVTDPTLYDPMDSAQNLKKKGQSDKQDNCEELLSSFIYVRRLAAIDSEKKTHCCQQPRKQRIGQQANLSHMTGINDDQSLKENVLSKKNDVINSSNGTSKKRKRKVSQTESDEEFLNRIQFSERQLNGNRNADVHVIKCGFCFKIFVDQHHLHSHQNVHCGSKPYNCEICQKAFGRLSALRKHVLTHTSTAKVDYNCNACDHRGSHRNSSSSSQCMENEPSNTTSYICTTCGKTCISASGLKRHQVIHQKFKSSQCEICDEEFLHESLLDDHMQIHKNEKPYKCRFCNKTFRQPANLQMHTLEHVLLKQIACETCGKIYDSAKNLQQHVYKHHKNKKLRRTVKTDGSSSVSYDNLQCKVCGDRFTRPYYLKKHMEIHNDSKRFQCETCHKKFTQSFALRRHLLTHRKGEKFRCSICYRPYADQERLEKHLVIHGKDSRNMKKLQIQREDKDDES